MKNHNLILWLKMYIAIFGKVFSFALPLIISASGLLSIMYLVPTQYLILFIVVYLLFTIIVVIFMIKLFQIFSEYEIISESVIDILKNDMLDQSKEIPGRAGRIYPDTPTVNLKPYIQTMMTVKSKGFLEFTNCQKMGLDISENEQLLLHTVMPGMHQYFMILKSPDDSDLKGYIRIYVPNNLGVDNRDFTETWFNHIFPLLGNLSNSISEKLLSGYDQNHGSELSESFFVVSNFKIRNRNNNGSVNLRIFL